MPAMNLRDEELAMVVVAARYVMPAPGESPPALLQVHEEQGEVPVGDEYAGEAGASSLKWEAQSSPCRPGTDIYVSGHAWAPRGTTAARVSVGVRIGAYQRGAVVFGARLWSYGLAGVAPSRPIPFERIPLSYERCFGGTVEAARGKMAEASDRNPIGCGLYANPENQPLPNIEDPAQLLRSPADRPLPQGFGPVGRGWMPRRTLAGTYSQTWIDTRAPLWPPDIDPRFFLAASPGLQAVPHLQGGEAVTLVGMHPDGGISCTLPQPRMVAKFVLSDQVERKRMVLDAVMLEPDELSLTMIWRAHVVVRPTMLAVQETVLRLLEDWEEAPPT